jgi:hypothetical protein
MSKQATVCRNGLCTSCKEEDDMAQGAEIKRNMLALGDGDKKSNAVAVAGHGGQ